MTDLFDTGYVELGIFQADLPHDFYRKASTPPRTTPPSPRSIPASVCVNGASIPAGEPGCGESEKLVARWDLKG